MASYSSITNAIRTICSTIRIDFAAGGDGRLGSAVKEDEYLQIFKNKMAELHPNMVVEIAPPRFWYDVRVAGIPINLKLTSLGTDNCMNKKAVYYSLTGSEGYPYASNWNDFWARIRDGPRKEMRVQSTEYHYLVVNKAGKRSSGFATCCLRMRTTTRSARACSRQSRPLSAWPTQPRRTS